MEGRGYNEGPKDAVSARVFFYSKRPEYVHWRSIWYGLAGIPEPEGDAVGRHIEALAKIRAERKET